MKEKKDTKLRVKQKNQEFKYDSLESVFGEKEMRSRMYSGASFPGPIPLCVFRAPEHISREYKD